MATGDINYNSTDWASILGLVAPAGSNVKDTSATDTTVTTTPGGGWNIFGPSTTTATTGPSSSTVGPSTSTQNIGATHSQTVNQQVVDPAGVTALVNQILSGSQGLAATAGQQHAQGGYNSSTNGLLLGNLVAQTAGQAALLNKQDVSTTDTAGSTNVTSNSGYTTTNSGSTTTTNNSGTTNYTGANPTTVETKTDPFSVSTNQTAQVSGNVAAGIAAGSLIYNALGQLVNKASGAVVDSATGLLKNSSGQLIGKISSNGEVVDQLSASDVTALESSTSSTLGDTSFLDGITSASTDSGIVDFTATATSSTATDAAVGAATDAAGSDAVGGLLTSVAESWIICTELYKQGKLPLKYYATGASTFNSYCEIGKKGYYIWAIPCVKHLRLKPNSYFSLILNCVFNWRAEYIAACKGIRGARKLKKGAIVSAVLYPTCWIIGHILHMFGYQIDYTQVYNRRKGDNNG